MSKKKKGQYDNFVQSSKELSKKKRIERRQNNAKEYQGGVLKTSPKSSDQAYIRGDIGQVALNKVYGHQQSLKNGEGGNLNKDAIRNSKKYKVKRTYKEPEKVKYNWFESVDKESKGFKNRLNSPKLDGLKTAKANQQTGKHLKNAGQYAVGALKDFIIDPALDVARTIDYGESALMGGAVGLLDHATSATKALVDPTAKFKDYRTKNVIKDNINKSLEESRKTGWGRSSGEFLDEMEKRDFEKEIEFHRRRGNDVVANQMLKDRAKENPNEREIVKGITGLIGDISNPINIGTQLSKGVRNVTGALTKDAKDIVRGTANVAPGIVPKEVSDTMEVVQTGKAKLDNFLTQLKGQRKIDGRTLNKKYTQTKDGYIPNLINQVDDVIDEGNNVDRAQRSFFDRNRRPGIAPENGMFPVQPKQIKPGQMSLDQEVEKWTSIIDATSDPKKTDDLYDALKQLKPEVYNHLMKDSDYADELLKKQQNVFDFTPKSVKKEMNKLNQRKMATLDKKKSINEDYKELEARRLKQSIEGSIKVPKRDALTSNHNKYSAGVDEFISRKVPTLSNEALTEYQKVFDNARKFNNNIHRDALVDVINKVVFKGEKVIRNNVPLKDLQQFTNYLDEVIRYTEATRLGKPKYNKFDKLGQFVEVDVPKTFERMDDIWGRNMTDVGFEEKLDLKNAILGTNTKSEITKPFEELTNIKKTRPLTQDEYKQWKDLKSRLELWDKIHKETRDLDYDDFLKYVETNYPNKSKTKNFKTALDEVAESTARKMQDKADTRNIEDVKRKQRLERSEGNSRANTELSNLDESLPSKIRDQEEQRKYKEFVSRFRKEHKFNYVDESRLKTIPEHVKSNYNMLNKTHFSGVFNNLKKLMDVEVNGLSNSKDRYTYNAIRRQVAEYRDMLLRNGVKDDVYFNEMKNYKANLIKTKLDKMNGLKVKKVKKLNERLGIKDIGDKSKLKNVKINPLEKLGVTINDENRHIDNLAKNKSLEMEYDRILNSTNIDELFEGYGIEGHIAQAGDNMSKINSPKYIDDMNDIDDVSQYLTKEVKDSLNSNNITKNALDSFSEKINKSKQMKIDGRKLNKNKTQTKDGYVPNKIEESPLDNIIKTNIDPDTQINMLGYITGNDIKVDKDILIPKKNKKKTNELFEPEFGGKYYDDTDKLANIDERIAQRLTPERMSEVLGEDISDVLKNMNEPSKYVKNTPNNAPESILRGSKQADELSITKDIEELAEAGIDAKKQPPKEKPKNMNPNLYQRWLNTYKKSVTVYNPGWHIQNFFQNKGQSYLGLGADAFKPQTEARQVLKAIQGKDVKMDNINLDLSKGRVMPTKELAEMAQKLGVVDGMSSDVIESKGLFPKIETAVDNSGLNKWLSKNEQTARLNHWIKEMQRGKSPEQALESVNKYLFDYGADKSKFDKIMGNVDPFWTFHKNNARLMLQSAVENPSEFSKVQRGLRNFENMQIDPKEKQNESSMYKEYQMPGASMYDPVNNGQYNYLFDEGTLPDFKGAIPSSKEELENKLNPILRLALQQSRGEGNFGNKIVGKDEEADWGEITPKERMGEVVAELNPILPILMKTGYNTYKRNEKLKDGKVSEEVTNKQILSDWIQYLTGHKGNWYRNLK